MQDSYNTRSRLMGVCDLTLSQDCQDRDYVEFAFNSLVQTLNN